MKIKVSDYISNFFVKKKMFHVFGVTGGGAMHLNDSFAKSKKLKFIIFHHEQSASMAADAFYRKKQTPCVLHTTSGPGATNSLTGVSGAWIDSIPMFVVSGQVPTNDMIKKNSSRQIGVQEINIIDLVKPITKYAISIKNENYIDFYLNKCFNKMINGKPGPVWLDVPLDIQSKIINTKKLKKMKNDLVKYDDNINLKFIEKQINNSSKPVIVIGNGIHISKSEKLFIKFLNKLKIPVISSWNASDIIETKNKLYVGRMGIFGDRASNFAVENCDLLIVLGSRLSIPQTGYKTFEFAKYSKKIIIDIDSKEFKNKKFNKIIYRKNTDLKFFLNKANKYFENRNLKKFNNWISLVNYWKNKYPVAQPLNKKDKEKINSFYFIDVLSDCLKGNETIVTDMGTSFTCTMQGLKIKNSKNQRLFTSSGLAAMGFGLPGAIGGYFAKEKNKIICVTGDGGLMFNIQELQTVKSYKIPMKIFVLENQGYLTMKLMQKKNFNLLVGSTKSSGLSFPNIKKIANSYSMKYFKLRKSNLRNQLKNILKIKTPTIIEVNMPPFQPLIPRTQNKLLPDGTFITPKLDDLFPFLSKKILNEERLKAKKIKNG